MKQPRTSTTLTTLTLFTTFTLCLAGCSPNQLATSKAPSEELSYSRQPVPPTTTPKTPTTSTPSLSTSADVWQSFPPAPADEPDDITAIRKGWENFEKASDQLMKDPTDNDFQPLMLTTSIEYGFRSAKDIASARDEGLKMIGDIQFRNVMISTPMKSENGTMTAVVTACRDISQAHIVLVSTGSTPSPEPGEVIPPAMETVVNMLQQPNGVWVAASWSGKASTC